MESKRSWVSNEVDVGDVAHTGRIEEPTKRGVVNIMAKFYDPLGVASLMTVFS